MGYELDAARSRQVLVQTERLAEQARDPERRRCGGPQLEAHPIPTSKDLCSKSDTSASEARSAAAARIVLTD